MSGPVFGPNGEYLGNMGRPRSLDAYNAEIADRLEQYKAGKRFTNP